MMRGERAGVSCFGGDGQWEANNGGACVSVLFRFGLRPIRDGTSQRAADLAFPKLLLELRDDRLVRGSAGKVAHFVWVVVVIEQRVASTAFVPFGVAPALGADAA